MKEILVILLTTALLEQAVVRRYVPGAAREPKAWFKAGCGVFIVLAISAVLTAVLDLYVLQPYGFGAARLVVMLALTGLFGSILGRQDACPSLCDSATGGVPLTVAAGAVLGVTIVCFEAAAAPAAALKLSLILGVSYAVLSFILAGILNRLDEEAMPEPVRGVPALALCAALIAIALMGLSGLSF